MTFFISTLVYIGKWVDAECIFQNTIACRFSSAHTTHNIALSSAHSIFSNVIGFVVNLPVELLLYNKNSFDTIIQDIIVIYFSLTCGVHVAHMENCHWKFRHLTKGKLLFLLDCNEYNNEL